MFSAMAKMSTLDGVLASGLKVGFRYLRLCGGLELADHHLLLL